MREVEKLLIETGQPYELHNGGKHILIYLAGEKIATISQGGRDRDTLKIQSAIRKRLKDLGV